MKNLLFAVLSVCCLSAHAQFSDVNMGDIIDVNGVKAIVFQIDETGCHGKAMTIKALRGVDDSFCNDRKLSKAMPATADDNDGMANTKAIMDFANSRNAIDKFPVFKWCNDLGEGWYVPSKKELEAFVSFWLGNEQTIDWDSDEETENVIDDSKPYYKQVNAKMVDAGGVPFINGVFTSTATDDGKVYVFSFNRQKNTWTFKKHSRSNLSIFFVGRAICRF